VWLRTGVRRGCAHPRSGIGFTRRLRLGAFPNPTFLAPQAQGFNGLPQQFGAQGEGLKE